MVLERTEMISGDPAAAYQREANLAVNEGR
jgi:hypothetical protein